MDVALRERVQRVPKSERGCATCHGAPKREPIVRPPMLDFPNESEDWRMRVDDRWRDEVIVRTFGEARQCGSDVFGCYGAIWLSKLRADARDGKLAACDRPHYERLHTKYALLLDR